MQTQVSVAVAFLLANAACGPTVTTDPIVAVTCTNHSVVTGAANQPTVEVQDWVGLVYGVAPTDSYRIERCNVLPYSRCNGAKDCRESGLSLSGETCSWEFSHGGGVFHDGNLVVGCGQVTINRDAAGNEVSRIDTRASIVNFHRN